MAPLPTSTGCHPNNIFWSWNFGCLSKSVLAIIFCYIWEVVPRPFSQMLRALLLSPHPRRRGDAAGKPRPVHWPAALGLPSTLSGESSHARAYLQVSAALNQALSKGLICSEFLMQRRQTDFVLFINSDWLEVAAWSAYQLAKIVRCVRVYVNVCVWVCTHTRGCISVCGGCRIHIRCLPSLT